MKIVFATVIMAIIVVSLSCTPRTYLPPAMGIPQDSTRTISDDEIKQAFESKSQLSKPFIAAIFDMAQLRTDFSDSLRQMDFIRNVYEIPKPLIQEDVPAYPFRYPYNLSYQPPMPEINMKKLRLLAAQGKADILVVLASSHTFRTSANWYALSYALIIPMLFVPGNTAEMTSEVDLFFVDVRNGFLYATYHDEARTKKNHVTLSYQFDKKDAMLTEQIRAMIPKMAKGTRQIFSNPDFYINQDK
jgi:hypothetical protein